MYVRGQGRANYHQIELLYQSLDCLWAGEGTYIYDMNSAHATRGADFVFFFFLVYLFPYTQESSMLGNCWLNHVVYAFSTSSCNAVSQ